MAASVHVLWLKPEDYPRFRAIFDDVDDTYDEWLARMERGLTQLKGKGVHVNRVLIDPDELVEWCRTNGCEVDSHARGTYAAIVGEQRERK